MRHEPDAGALDDLLAGSGGWVFDEGDMQIHVGWLRMGGNGLIVTARVDEGVVGQTRFWCDAQQWCDWLAPSLPAPSWDALPCAWHASAASLTLAPGGMGAATPNDAQTEAMTSARIDAGGTTSWPCATSIACEPVDTAWRVGMVLRREGRQLALTYLDGATSWLRERCKRAMPCDAPLDPAGWPQRQCALVAGWVALPAAQCEHVHAGDAVLLDVAADVERGEYWLVDGDHAIAMREGQPSDRGVVQFVGTDAVRCYATIAERQFPIPWLMAWRSGDVAVSSRLTLAGTLHAGPITLWRERSRWAGGRLLRFGDGRLAVHIQEHTGVSTGHSMPVRDRPPGDISGGDPMGVHPEGT